MYPADLPDHDRMIQLMDARADASVTIALTSSPLPQDHERIKIALRDAVDDAGRRLAELDLPHGAARAVTDRLTSLVDDDEFWAHQYRGLVVFATPDGVNGFRLPDEVTDSVRVGDRFDVAPLLRATAFDQRVFVLQLSMEMARLTEFGAGTGAHEHRLHLPGDHRLMLQHTSNHGDSDRDRARGATGDRIERERFCRVVQDEVVRIVPAHVPLVIDATDDLEPAYRAVNTHPTLLDDAIAPHPESLDDERLETEVRRIMDRHLAAEISAWKERFGTLRSQGLATSRLNEVAAAAVAAAVDELRFNADAPETGTIDEFGRVSRDDGPAAPRLVDELAARVLHGGGRVRAVRNADLLDGSPVAATLRFPVPQTP